MKKKQVSNGSAQESAETFVLLIWEEVPENTKLFLIPSAELNDDEVDVFRAANGKLQNTVGLTNEQADAIDKISNALCTNEKYLGHGYAGTRWGMRLAKFIVDDGAPIEGKRITSVFRAGYVM